MKIDELMKTDVHVLSPTDSVQSAARTMAETGEDALPVGTPDKIDGIVTLRDLVIRVLAEGLDPRAISVSEVMSSELATCAPDSAPNGIRREMIRRQIRRMPVLDAEGRLIGMINLADLADDPEANSPNDLPPPIAAVALETAPHAAQH